MRAEDYFGAIFFSIVALVAFLISVVCTCILIWPHEKGDRSSDVSLAAMFSAFATVVMIVLVLTSVGAIKPVK